MKLEYISVLGVVNHTTERQVKPTLANAGIKYFEHYLPDELIAKTTQMVKDLEQHKSNYLARASFNADKERDNVH